MNEWKTTGITGIPTFEVCLVLFCFATELARIKTTRHYEAARYIYICK